MENIVSRYAEIISSLGLSGFVTVVLPTENGATAYHSAIGYVDASESLQNELVDMSNGATFDRCLDFVDVESIVCDPSMLNAGIVREVEKGDNLYRTWSHEVNQSDGTSAIVSIVDTTDWTTSHEVRRKLTDLFSGFRVCES